eukprot:scaffold12670_cov119-Isochrysis_galbana.AAC.8
MNFHVIIASARVPIPAFGKAKRIDSGWVYDWASAKVECAFVCSSAKSAEGAMRCAVGVSLGGTELGVRLKVGCYPAGAL